MLTLAGSLVLFILLPQAFGLVGALFNYPHGTAKSEEAIKKYEDHFRQVGSPLMLGGNQRSLGLLGIARCAGTVYLLILDPHYNLSDYAPNAVAASGFGWRKAESVFQGTESFNILRPQHPNAI